MAKFCSAGGRKVGNIPGGKRFATFDSARIAGQRERTRLRILLLEVANQLFQGELVAVDSQSGELVNADVADVGVSAKGFALADVGDVHFHSRTCHRRHCVPQSDTGVREAAWVDDQTIHFDAVVVQVVDDLALVVGLKKAERAVERSGFRTEAPEQIAN